METPLKGNIKEISLPRLLVYLNRNRKTGTLIVKNPVFTKKVYLAKGDAIFASSSYEDDRLGEMLVKAGKITLEQYDKSVELLKKTGKRQGAILVELGYLTPKDLFWGVKYQVKEIIYSLFQLEDAEYEFVEGEIPKQEVITLKMSMGTLIYEGVKRINNLTRIKNEMPDANSVLKLSADPISLFQEIELSEQDRKMLSLVDGNRTIKQLINTPQMGSFEAMKILYVLWSIGVIKEKEREVEEMKEEFNLAENLLSAEEILQPLPAEEEGIFIQKVDEMYSRLDTITPYDLLDVDEGADEETIKKNYYRLTREFHPDRYYSSADPTMKDKLTAIFDSLKSAYEILIASKMEKKEVREEKKPAETVEVVKDAEDYFKHGVGEFKKKNFTGAVESLRLATKIDPKKAKYWSYLSLFLTKIPNKLKDAEDALLEAITLEPYNDEHYVNLGMIYIKAGSKKRAYNQFEKALKFNPENEKAKKGLEQTKE